MTVVDFVKTNTQILSNCPIGLKIFNIGRDGTPCVFDSEKDEFSVFRYCCAYDIDHWYYVTKGAEKYYCLYIDEVD
jgi:hypothetical protein